MTPDPHPASQNSVTDSQVVHIQREQRAGLFWRGVTVVSLFFIVVIVAVLIGVPVLLMVMFWNPWLLFTLIFAAAGVLLLVKTVGMVRKLVWHAHHRSSYVLREAGIQVTEWNAVGAEAPVLRTVPWETVASVVASYRIMRRIILTENGGGTLTETAPMLLFLFDRDGHRQIAGIPFSSHQDPAIDIWIEELRTRGVELGYTAQPLSWKGEAYLGPEAQLEYLATTEEVIPFPATGGWWKNTPLLEDRWHRNAQQIQEQAERRDPGLREARLQPTYRHWILGAWLASMYAVGAGYLLPYLVQRGSLPAGTWPLEFLVVLPAAALFFWPLRRGLRWHHGLVCWLLLVVIAFAVLVGTMEIGPAAEEMAMIGFGLTIVSAGLLWIPYLLVKRSAHRDELAATTRSGEHPTYAG
ncbi:hypothetical protein [Citricoccus nitrophenolicus]|uniref:hypothetical protein n=1 Tax=Citricoccus nitrophenolicus TaxID=863575 RepID=UPI0031ED3898